MAQYDLHRLHSGDLVIDCQTDFLNVLQTRLVVPLINPDSVPDALPRLHPLFDIDGDRLLMATHLAASIPSGELGYPVASLASENYTIINAIDFLLTGV
jgi:toxin CcdB